MPDANIRDDERPTIDEVRAALERIAGSEAFRACPQLVAFLRYVVEATLRGGQDRIKGYTIAVEALGRGDDFDPQDDPIVRVEAMRLRRALQRYYANGGSDDVLRIELPLGSYVPVFRRRAPRDATACAESTMAPDAHSARAWHDFLLFLTAYMDDDRTSAAQYAALMPADAHPLDLVARALIAAHRGETESARALLERLGVSRADWRKDIARAPSFGADAIARRIARDLVQIEGVAAAKP